MVSYNSTFVVTVYRVFGELNSSPHEVIRGFISPKPLSRL